MAGARKSIGTVSGNCLSWSREGLEQAARSTLYLFSKSRGSRVSQEMSTDELRRIALAEFDLEKSHAR